MKTRAFAALVLFLLSTRTQAAPPTLDGLWHWAGNTTGTTKMIVHQDGARISGRIASPPLRWDFEGSVNDAGELDLIRWIPVTELKGTPQPVITQLLAQYGDPAHPGMLKGKIIVKHNASANELRGYYTRLKPNYTGDTLLWVDEVRDDMFVTRGEALPDLRIESYSIETFEDPENKLPRWKVLATVRNAGSGATPDRIALHLRRLNTWGPSPNPETYVIAYSATSHPALAPGESATIEWRTDHPTGTANSPNIVDRDIEIAVVVDPENRILETNEDNNEKTAIRVDCADPELEIPNPLESLWVPKPGKGEADTVPDYSALMDKAPNPARAVLCYIRMEAQRQARLDRGTVAGSRLVRSLQDIFLADYFRNPTPTTGVAAVEKIGEGQGVPALGFGAYMYVPRGLRERYPNGPFIETWEWLYPATQFWVIRTDLGDSVGKNIQHIRFLDVPFLVGRHNSQPGDDADAVYGGKNLSNVMHWATGTKYWNIPEDAMRELFIGYEYWHMEGWDVAGEDSINDLIAEEQGRMLGVRLSQATIRSVDDLVQAMDQDFRRSRAWVGAMLRERRQILDDHILAADLPRSDFWFQGRRQLVPWTTQSVQQRIDGGASALQVAQSGFVEQLIKIYELIYAAKEYERRVGPVGLTDVTRRTVRDEYNDQFRAAPKDFGARWEWRP